MRRGDSFEKLNICFIIVRFSHDDHFSCLQQFHCRYFSSFYEYVSFSFYVHNTYNWITRIIFRRFYRWSKTKNERLVCRLANSSIIFKYRFFRSISRLQSVIYNETNVLSFPLYDCCNLWQYARSEQY